MLPCSGIGKNSGTLSRWAAFELASSVRPEKVRLLCLARLTVGDEDASELLKGRVVLTIDGCTKKCATLNAERRGARVAKSYLAVKFIARHKDLKLGRDVTDPGPDALVLAKRLAEEIASDVDELDQLDARGAADEPEEVAG
ncbi:MAG: putative zinc-binding protein [Promethearchaeota archaeon]